MFYLKNLIYFALEFGPIDLGKLIINEKDNVVLEAEHVKCIMK